ncbi:hypothetical protein HBN50_07085 [Halobacteriovorax sp. GB3]|uniref:hypothetical protein n=1 Tax=Halobacteriovorax sp. GB3 TaxID=2719615 RepID=UPI00235ED0EF|nr:hypothetical protein [Halobacteriovorax sp. GB3]MDD0852852.1 hypothetical protein [Halobacteriovorax sp. GB3]
MSFGQELIKIRTSLGYDQAKSFFLYLQTRGLECNYQYYVKIEKNQAQPSIGIVNQMAYGLCKARGEQLILAYCQNQFEGFSYLFDGKVSKKQRKNKLDIDSSSQNQTLTKKNNSGQKELSLGQIQLLGEKKENYFLFLLLTLSRDEVSLSDISLYKDLYRSISALIDGAIVVVEDEAIRPVSSEFRFPKSYNKNIDSIYKSFDLWDTEFSAQFEFDQLINKMMIRRISPRYLNVIEKQIDSLSDLVRLSDESDPCYNNDVIHLNIRLSKGKLPG